jgi:hypothetical protein
MHCVRSKQFHCFSIEYFAFKKTPRQGAGALASSLGTFERNVSFIFSETMSARVLFNAYIFSAV